MNGTTISVSDFTLVKTSIIDNIKIRVSNIDLFKSVSLNVTLMSGKTFVDSKNFTLSGADYLDWGNDDTYINNYVLNALNMSPAIVSS